MIKGKAMYTVWAQHYGERAQKMEPKFKLKWHAHRFMLQQGEILKGYNKSTGMVDGCFVVFGDEGIFKTMMWVGKCEK